MRASRSSMLAVVAGSAGVLIAYFSIEQPAPPQFEDDAQPPSSLGAEQSDISKGSEQEAAQPDDREPAAARRFEQAGARADAEAQRQPEQPEPIARAAPTGPAPTSETGPPAFNLDAFEQTFSSEGRDPEWSSGMEGRILDEISQLSGLSANLIEVDCRVTRCRLRLTLPDTATPRQAGLISSSGSRPEFNVGAEVGLETEVVLFLRSEPGLNVFLTYLRRPGFSTIQSNPEAPSSV